MPSETTQKLPKRGSALKIPPEAQHVEPCLRFVEAWASSRGLENGRQESLLAALRILLDCVIKNNERFIFQSDVEIDVFVDEGSLVVELLNRGFPIFQGAEWGEAESDCIITSKLAAMQGAVDAVVWENRGREGQSVRLVMKVPERRQTQRAGLEIVNATGPACAVDATVAASAPVPVEEPAIEIRRLRPGEEPALSRLFCSVYGYNYINEYVYFPEKLRAMIEAGRLISTVAVQPDGRIVGHVGLVKWSDAPAVYEAALGLTDSQIKSKGLFTRLLDATMDIASKIPMQYCVYDFVTNHVFSQKQVARHGSSEMAIYIGSQISATQAKLEALGIGTDPKEMDRYSMLLAIKKHVAHPFGREVTLPVNIGEMTEFLLKPLGVSWLPAPRFYPLPALGTFTKELQPTQKAVIFDFAQPGYKALEALVAEWRHLLRSDYRYAAVEMPLDIPGVGQTYDYLSKNGFFISGFVPYRFTDRLGIRFQSIGPSRISFDEIKVHTDTARQLLQMVRNDYERNVRL